MSTVGNLKKENFRVINERCLGCAKMYSFKEHLLWEQDCISCPHCEKRFVIKK